MQKDKIETLIGFMVKAGKIVYGIDTIAGYRKKFFMIIVCNSSSFNTKKEAEYIAKNKKISTLITLKPLEEIVFKKNCKVIAITDKRVCDIIKENININYNLFEFVEETN